MIIWISALSSLYVTMFVNVLVGGCAVMGVIKNEFVFERECDNNRI